MGYNDKEIQITTQLSYINFSNDSIDDYYKDNNEYPTLKYLLNNNESMLEEFYKMFYLGNLPEDAENNFAYQATEKLNKERAMLSDTLCW